MTRDPAGQALLDRELNAADGVREHLRSGPDRQLVVFEQVDEAGVAVGRLGRQIDDALQHRTQLDRRGDELDDAVKCAVLLAEAGELSDTGHMCLMHMLPAAQRRCGPYPRPAGWDIPHRCPGRHRTLTTCGESSPMRASSSCSRSS